MGLRSAWVVWALVATVAAAGTAAADTPIDLSGHDPACEVRVEPERDPKLAGEQALAQRRGDAPERLHPHRSGFESDQGASHA